MTISEIENLTESEVKNIAEEEMTFKNHNIYFVTIDGAFGYSAIVYKNNHQIKYANDYELHHPNKSKEQLHKMYMRKYRKSLYTEKDFAKPLKSYDDYRSKLNYLINWYALQIDHVSMFGIFNTDEQIKAHEESIKDLTFDPAGYCYVKDPEFAKKHMELMNTLSKLRDEMEQSYDYMKSAFLHEMWNHEYIINWQGDWDVCSVFYDCEYGDNKSWLDYLNDNKVSDDIIRAFKDARDEYMKKAQKYA